MPKPDPKMAAEDVARDAEALSALCDLWRGTDIWITMNGRSMSPTIRPGSKILIRCDETLIVPGAIVAFRRDKGMVVHRFVEYAGAVDGPGVQIVCRGDANGYNDPPIPISDVVGVVVEFRAPTVADYAHRIGRAAGRRWRRIFGQRK
jgi:hypothetical protein